MKKILSRIVHEKTKHALIAVSFVALSVFVVAPLLPQVDSTLDAVALRAGTILAVGGDAGGSGDSGAGGTDSGGAGDGGYGTEAGGCCGSESGSTDPGTDQSTPPPPPPPPAPRCTLSANPQSLSAGGGTTRLSWTTDNAYYVSINQGVGRVSSDSSKYVTVGETKTFTLTATGDGGTVTCDTTVTVAQPSAPACTFTISPDNFPYGGGTSVFSWTTDNATAVTIDGGVGSVALDGSKNVPVSNSKTYTLTATGPGGSVTCTDSVSVSSPSAPSCTISANPNNLPFGGGNTLLSWSSQNATAASLNHTIGSVSVSGTKNVFAETSKTYTLTVTGPGGTATCDAPVTVSSPSAPSCTLTASPNTLPYGGGNSLLSWTTDNATSVTLNNAIGSVALDGSKNVFVPVSKTYTLTATGPGGSVTCDAPVTVTAQPLPSCNFTASPNNFPYGGGTTVLAWSTQNADSVSIDQGVGVVTKTGTRNAYVQNTKTYTLTATNQTGSVTCNAPVTVGEPSQPTCALTVDPNEINAGDYSRVEWSSTNVTSVVIKKIVGGVESPFKTTNAGSGSIIVSPQSETIYKGTFTGPGGSVQCEATLKIRTPNTPTCAISAAPNSFPYGGGNTVLTWSSENATQASIDQGIGQVTTNGNRTVVVSSGKTYKLTVTGPGGTNTCEVPIIVGPANAPACTVSASPSNLPYGGGNTTLTWTSQNAATASFNEGIGSVTINGSKSVVTQTAKTYTLTVTGYDGRTATCSAPVTISAPQEPSCTLSANPNSLPYGGGNSVLTWDTENATAVSIDQGVGAVTLDGSKNVVVAVSKVYTLTATGPGGTKTCTAPVTVTAQPLPSCNFTASPNNFPYGGGTTQLTWSTQNADSVSIDQGVGAVNKNGVQSAVVPTTRTFTLTATNQTGSVTCAAPVTVGNPSQPTCALTVDPNEIISGNNARVEWTSTNVTSVVIKKIIDGVESSFQDTSAGAGSVIVAPTATTTYKGTFTGPGGTVSCDATLKVKVPQEKLSCDSFTISPRVVDDNDNATMSWNTSNAEHVTINNGVGSVDRDGSRTIKVTEDKTYTLTAIRGSEQVTCTASVEVDEHHNGSTPSPRCELFKASDTRITEGETVDLRWETKRGTKLEIEPNIFETSDDDEVEEGRVTVMPKKDTKYTLTVWKGSKKDTCTVKVNVEDEFTVLSARDQLPLTSISFTDIPYTGFDAGPFLTSMFYTLLALWSIVVAYIIVVKRGSVFGLGGGSHSGTHGGGAVIPSQEYETHTADVHAATVAPVHHEPEIFSAHTPVVAQSTVTHDAHASHAPHNLPTASMPSFTTTVATVEDEDEYEVEEDDDMAQLEAIAHAHNILLSSDALRMIIDQYEDKSERARLLSTIVERAKATYPREDGWIILNRERVVTLFRQGQQAPKVAEVSAPVVAEQVGAQTLAEAIVTGNTALAYQMLGTSPLLEIADAAEALDRVIRARKDASVFAEDLLVRAAARISEEKLKNAVAALVSAIDGTYTDEVAAVRLAVIKALKAVA